MNLYEFVWTCFPARVKWLNGHETQDQGAVLAFDLGTVGGKPPNAEKWGHEWVIEAGESKSPSGPWCAGVIAGKRPQNSLHAEERLLEHFDSYLERYTQAYKKYPSSVSLYTFFSPCKNCVGLLKDIARHHGKNIPLWLIYFDQPNVAVNRTGKAKRKKKQKYLTFDQHMKFMETFSKWQVWTVHF